MYSGPKASSSAAAAASAATRLTWWVAASAGKTASSSGGVSSGSFQTITPDCGPENVLPALPVMHRGALGQRVLELAAGDQPELVGAVEEDLAAPLARRSSAISRTGSGNRVMLTRRARSASACAARPRSANASRSTSSSCGVERDVDDVQAADAGRAVVAVARMAADRLRDRHHRVAGLGQRGVDGHVADHARDQPVLGVVGLEQPLEQLDAQRLDLVDVLRAREPAVDRADVALGGALADLGGEQLPRRSGSSAPRARAG